MKWSMLRLPVPCKIAAVLAFTVAPLRAAEPFRVEIVDQENGWPVPLIELRTTNYTSFFTDNAGLAAIDAPELLGREIWLGIVNDGYSVKADGYGSEGFRTTMTPGGKIRIEVERKNIAKRLGRLTGAGLFSESQKLGEPAPLRESGVMGSDSVLVAKYHDRLFWLWGDTSVPHYALGNYNSTMAVTPLAPLGKFQPPIALAYSYFEEKGRIRGVTSMTGPGPTWLGAMTAFKDAAGGEKLVGTYSKIENHLDESEIGLCVWDDSRGLFDSKRVLWKKGGEKPQLIPRGHPFPWTDPAGRAWMLFGDPFPAMRCPAAYEAYLDPKTWEAIPAPDMPKAADGSKVEVQRGSVCWNTYRKKWITVFQQKFGKPSAFGELWYAEADSPMGPWGTAVKVLSHRNYTFYNPRIDHELTKDGDPFIVFEGTYTAEFADHAAPVPKYNYNQLLYRLDLDDPQLAPAR